MGVIEKAKQRGKGTEERKTKHWEKKGLSASGCAL
jgi:stalled ribosome alternative rescue factor ArfA